MSDTSGDNPSSPSSWPRASQAPRPSSRRPMQSVRVSTNPPELADPPPRRERAFAGQTLIGMPLPAVLPLDPPPSAPLRAWEPSPAPVETAEPNAAVAPAEQTQAPASEDVTAAEPSRAAAPDEETEAAAAAPVGAGEVASVHAPRATEPISSRDATPSPSTIDHVPFAPAQRRRLHLGLAAVAALLAAGAIWLLRPGSAPPATGAPAVPAESPASERAAASPPPASTAEPAAARAETAGAADPAPMPDLKTVVLKAMPEGAKFLRAGREVGVSTLTVELAPGEKRAFEVVLPGYGTRKVVVDGSKPEIMVGLVRSAAAQTAAADEDS